MKILITTMPVNYSQNIHMDFISQRVAPNGAIYLLGAIVREKGYDVSILDPYVLQNDANKSSFDEAIINHVSKADILCLSSNSLNWACTSYAIRKIREKLGSSITIVIGGLHPTYFYDYIIRNYDVDYILRGEGEETLPHLIRAIEKGTGFSEIEGVISKKHGISDKNKIVPILDSREYEKLPLPAFDLLPDEAYDIMLIETSRGCKFNCVFCSVPHRNNWRAFDEEVVMDRAEKIISRYADKFCTKGVLITDDCLTSDFNRASRIIKNLEKIDSEIIISIESRITDWLKDDADVGLSIFSSPQVRRILFGIESGYDEGLRKISKGLTIEKVEQALNLFESNNVLLKSYFSFIIGFPWESLDDCIKTIDYAASIVKRCSYAGVVNLNWLQIGLATLFWTKLLRTRNYFNYSSYPADFRVFNPLYSTGVR